MSAPDSTARDSFERTFVAVTALLGRRAALDAGLAAPGTAARSAALVLSTAERAERAALLAALLAPLAAALESRRLA